MKNKTLKKIFEEQKEFQRYFYDPDNISDEDKLKFTKEYILSIHKELGEILDTMPWKLHRKEDETKLEHNTVEEIIDCFKFLLNLCIIWGIDADNFAKEFFRKSMVVRQRYNQEVLNVINKTDKVCAIDLDDVLAESSEYFVKIYNVRNSTDFKKKKDIKSNIDALEYENFKTWYRESGEKINIPVKKDAKELCEKLKNLGYKIVIISSRPYKKHNRIFPDTLEWLNKNKIPYDTVYFEKDKHIKILKQLPNLSFIIEDNPEYAKYISEEEYNVFLLSNNSEEKSDEEIRNHLLNKYIINVDNLSEIINYEHFPTKIKQL